MNRHVKNLAKIVLQHTVGRLPPASSRLTGRLAKDGGQPVRDLRLRPWARAQANSFLQWSLYARPELRKIFSGRLEGVAPTVTEQFAQRWAEYCGCRYGLLMAHGTDALRFALAAALDHD